MKGEEVRKIGEKIGVFEKMSMGGCGFFILLLILLLPLILFSSLNPTKTLNNVTDANIELSISFRQNDIANNYTLYHNDYVSNILPMTNDTWKAYNYSDSVYTKGFDLSQVQIISMYNTSDTMWSLSIPHIDIITDRLTNYNTSSYDIYLNLKYSFSRPLPLGAQNSLKSFSYPLFFTSNTKAQIPPGFKNRTDVLNTFRKDLSFCSGETIQLTQFYVPSIRLSADPHPKIIKGDGPDSLPLRDVKLNFQCSYNNSNNPPIDYTKSYYNFSLLNPPDGIEQGIVFHTFSDMVSSTNTNYDVVTFYISFILVVGRLVRGAISGEAERIVYTEMPEPKKILILCEGIKIHRYRSEFEREEHLFYVLIDLMRSPEILKLITKSSIKWLAEKKEKEKKSEEARQNARRRNEGENKMLEELKENKEQAVDQMERTPQTSSKGEAKAKLD